MFRIIMITKAMMMVFVGRADSQTTMTKWSKSMNQHTHTHIDKKKKEQQEKTTINHG